MKGKGICAGDGGWRFGSSCASLRHAVGLALGEQPRHGAPLAAAAKGGDGVLPNRDHPNPTLLQDSLQPVGRAQLAAAADLVRDDRLPARADGAAHGAGSLNY